MVTPDEPRVDKASRLILAAPEAVYAAFTDPDALMAWLPPAGMTGRALLSDTPPGDGRYHQVGDVRGDHGTVDRDRRPAVPLGEQRHRGLATAQHHDPDADGPGLQAGD